MKKMKVVAIMASLMFCVTSCEETKEQREAKQQVVKAKAMHEMGQFYSQHASSDSILTRAIMIKQYGKDKVDEFDAYTLEINREWEENKLKEKRELDSIMQTIK